MRRRTFIAVAAGFVAAPLASAFGQTAAPAPPAGRPRWGAMAEKDFRLGQGMGPRLMTEEEWKEHQQKMATMSPEERQKYRDEVHAKMMERAKEKGITMPPAPRPGAARRGPPS